MVELVFTICQAEESNNPVIQGKFRQGFGVQRVLAVSNDTDVSDKGECSEVIEQIENVDDIPPYGTVYRAIPSLTERGVAICN
jgi:hypothetical protein